MENVPEKTCTIDKLVTIQEEIDKVLAGKKTASRRNGIYANVGEIMELQDKKFKIDDVYPQYLGDITDKDAMKEGYDDLKSYQQAILNIHPGMRWSPKMRVWVHEYSSVI
ncbi:ASCH domain-containing protein [Virgibacillus ihumii]|uniref:ASCH domain-containing protein n=1 Tax=Virgibacillus ihumii TaxID=2686091 RepID=UPI00157D39D5|nr:ASCH domain-containing protein [Virgibacillus ihumii]